MSIKIKLVRLINRGTHCRAFYDEYNADGFVRQSNLIISHRDAIRLMTQYNVSIERQGHSSVEQERLCDTWQDPHCYPQLDPNKDFTRNIGGTSFAQELRAHILFCLEEDDAEDPNVYSVY